MTPRGRAQPLTRDAIVDASLWIIKQDGTQGLTMRAVAARLGVSQMAAYRHVADKGALLQLVFDRLAATSEPLRAITGESWETTLERYLVEGWRRLCHYPGLSVYALTLPNLGIDQEKYDAALQFFECAGFSTERAHMAVTFATTFIVGRNAVDAQFHFDESELTPDGRPAFEHLHFGIAAVIAGLRAMLDEVPQDATTRAQVKTTGRD